MDAGGIDLAILDGEATPVGGMGIAKQLKDEIDDCPPILVLTGRADDAWLANWSRAEAAVPHPIDPIRLAEAVVACCALPCNSRPSRITLGPCLFGGTTESAGSQLIDDLNQIAAAGHKIARLWCSSHRTAQARERHSDMSLYIPILVLGAIAAAFAVVSVGIALLAGPRRYNRAKLEAYECGIEPMPGQRPAGAGSGSRSSTT